MATRHVRAAVLLLALTLAACSTSRNAAERSILGTAGVIVNQVETSPAFTRGQWATAGVNYLKAGVEQYGGFVLGSEVVNSGTAANNELIGWVEAQFTETATAGGFGGDTSTATLCVRFEVRWQEHPSSDDVLSYHEIDCASLP